MEVRPGACVLIQRGLCHKGVRPWPLMLRSALPKPHCPASPLFLFFSFAPYHNPSLSSSSRRTCAQGLPRPSQGVIEINRRECCPQEPSPPPYYHLWPPAVRLPRPLGHVPKPAGPKPPSPPRVLPAHLT